LSIVKGLVRLHGGDVAIHSRVGEGTRVSVRLPLDCERVSPAKPRSAGGPAGDIRFQTLKLADDVAVQTTGPVSARDRAAPPTNVRMKKSA
jgi:two-component system, cell cycle sensor histidine kinase DivJ